MQVSLICTFTCACGATASGVMVVNARVNKHALRGDGNTLALVPRECRSCGALLPAEATAVVAESDRERINAARARKGWPALTDWRVKAVTR